MLKNIFILVFLIWGIDSSLAMNEQHPQTQLKSPLTVITVDGHKIYTAKVKLKSGEIAYFGYEPIYDEQRRHKWYQYKELTMDFTKEKRGALGIIFMPNQFEKVISRIFPTTKKHETEVINLIDNVPSDKKIDMERAMFGISGGVIGFSTSVGTHVAYISKEPITGFFPLPEVAPESLDFDAYIEAYGNLIMAISSYHAGEGDDNIFIHRGIFRNPISMMRKDYQGVGILLHAFASYARFEAEPHKITMQVDPDTNYKMIELLEKTFSQEDMIYDTLTGHYIIKRDALKKKFLEADIIK